MGEEIGKILEVGLVQTGQDVTQVYEGIDAVTTAGLRQAVVPRSPPAFGSPWKTCEISTSPGWGGRTYTKGPSPRRGSFDHFQGFRCAFGLLHPWLTSYDPSGAKTKTSLDFADTERRPSLVAQSGSPTII